MITKPFAVVTGRRARDGFTLAELLISVVVITLIILMVGQLMSSATAVARTGNKHIDTDTQARALLDRMAVDFAQMLKRTDVDIYVKAPIGYKNPKAHGNGLKLKVGQQGNDQIAFFSQVAGYYPSSTNQSPVSLVAYRVNSAQTTLPSYLTLERMGKGLLWNAVSNGTTSSSPYPIVFVPGQIAPPPPPANAPAIGPWAGPWSAAINNDNSGSSTDPDYETVGPGVFRLEYYYLLKDGTVTDAPKIDATTSWDTTKTLSANLNAFSDVEAIAVAIAVIDPASRSLLYDASNPGDPYHCLFSILSDMPDFKTAPGRGVGGAKTVGDIEFRWNQAVQSAAATGKTSDGLVFPPAAASAIRIYNRYFDVRTPAQF